MYILYIHIILGFLPNKNIFKIYISPCLAILTAQQENPSQSKKKLE